MLAKLINEKFANKKDGNQLLEVYEEQEVSSELEPELISPRRTGCNFGRNRQRKWGRRREQENIPGIKSYSRSKNSYIFLQSSQEKIWRRLYI